MTNNSASSSINDFSDSFLSVFDSSEEFNDDSIVDNFPVEPIKEFNIDPTPISRWTRPSFFEKQLGKPKKQTFAFNFEVKLLQPFDISLGNLHYRWIDGFWFNLGTDYQASITMLNQKGKKALLNENRELKTEIEVLLELNTNYELKKQNLREKLKIMEDLILSYPGIDL